MCRNATSAGRIYRHSAGTRLQNASMKRKSTAANATHFNTQYQHSSKNSNPTEQLATIQMSLLISPETDKKSLNESHL